MLITKRDGSEQKFDANKVHKALEGANTSVDGDDKIDESVIDSIVDFVEDKCKNATHVLGVEDIQDAVQYKLMQLGKFRLVQNFIKYRYEHALARKGNSTDGTVLSLLNHNNEELNQENANKNPIVVSTQRDYMAGEVSKDICRRFMLPPDIVKAHDEKIIHYHDMDYECQPISNCCLINIEDMLQNGTVISGVRIDKPHSFLTACNVMTQIIAQVASSQYGGSSVSIAHIAPFVEVSRQSLRESVKVELEAVGIKATQDEINKIAELRLKKEIAKGVETIQYQILTLQTTNGQAPFNTQFMYLGEVSDSHTKDDLALIIEEILKQRYKGVKNVRGQWITNPFPKLIYVLEEDNIHPDSKYWYLTQLAAKCTAKRLVPDYISEKKMKALKEGNCYPVMGCRSCLSVWHDENGKAKFYGRFNCGVVTINLPDVALSCGCNLDKFWDLFDERLELCHRALQIRHKKLHGVKSDVAPIMWQHGAIARLKPGETIDKLLYGGYSTISLGYAGLWNCVYALTKSKLTEPAGKELGLLIMKHMNEKLALWRKQENIGYAIYGTPIESTTYQFAKALQKRFGIIEGVTDKNYIVNSYHVSPAEPINAFDKLKLEAEFQDLSLGGAISYVEVPNLQKNIPAVLTLLQYMYDNIMYSELNTCSDMCACGWDQEIDLVKDENGKLIWKCPNCGTTDKTKLYVVRRVCGYLSSGNDLNQGRLADIKDRVLHL